MSLPPGTSQRVVDKLFPEPSPYKDKPEKWVEERLKEAFWSKQQDIAASVVENRYTAVPSAHDTGKSYTASRIMSWWIDAHDPGEAFVVSTAPSQTQVEAILWREVGKAHRKGDLVGRITYGMVPQWKIGAEIVGFGRKPQDLLSTEDAMAAFQGIHARFVLIVIDEAGGVPKWLYDAVDTLATNESARVLAIGNPDDPASEFEKICRPGSGWHVIPISAFDSPNFTDEEVDPAVAEELVSKTWVEERKKRWGVGSPLYTAKVLGQFPDVSDDTLISPKFIKAAQELQLPGLEIGTFGGDVARFGDDETCVYRNRGGVVRQAYIARKQDTTVTTGGFGNLMRDTQNAVPMQVDAIGVGAGVYDNLREQNYPVYEFIAGAEPYDKVHFMNRRAEVYWQFREGVEEGLIDLPPEGEDDELIAQLGSIKWKLNSRGRILIESKDEMKARGLPSPDRADAAVMSYIGEADWNLKELAKLRAKAPPSLTSDLMEMIM